jgi:hypothetical protein
MRFRRMSTKMLGALSLVAIALMATAGSALAWNTTTSGAFVYGTITVTHNGAEPQTCTMEKAGIPANLWKTGTTNYFETFLVSGGEFKCPNYKTLRWLPKGEVKPEGSGYTATVFAANAEGPSPWGWYTTSGSFKRAWVNASGGVPSHITLSNDKIGSFAIGLNLYATGTLYFTTGFGGVLTVP